LPAHQTLTKGFPVEVKIGVQNVAREIVLESEHSPLTRSKLWSTQR